MKVVCIDNYNRDYISDRLVCENVSKFYGDIIVVCLNERIRAEGSDYFVLRPDDYKLFTLEP